jgi:hypothetical protein
MTAFLNADALRAHAVPVSLYEALRNERPALVAWWLIAPDRQLVCRWRTDDRAPDVPPG